MAEALIKGLLSSKFVKNHNIVVSDISSKRPKHLKASFRVVTAKDNIKAVKKADVVVLAVKPQNMASVLLKLRPELSRKQLVVSIAAGISLKNLERAFKKTSLARVIPNNTAFVGFGITAISAGKSVTRSQREIVERIFRSVGDIVHVREKDMDAVTALSGSGPAFVYDFLKAMVEAGVSLGLRKERAEKLSQNTDYRHTGNPVATAAGDSFRSPETRAAAG